MKSKEIFNLQEAVTDLPEGSSAEEQIDIIISRLSTAKRALGIANRLTDAADRKKYKSRTLVFINQLRGMLIQLQKQIEQDIEQE